jgi:transposase
MARERRVFSAEFKREAVKLVNQPGATKAAIGRDLGFGANLPGRRCREVSGETTVSSGNSEKVPSQAYERMRRELAKVRAIARNLLDPQFAATAPNQKWAADLRGCQDAVVLHEVRGVLGSSLALQVSGLCDG